jgi:hypothetical protein
MKFTQADTCERQQVRQGQWVAQEQGGTGDWQATMQ